MPFFVWGAAALCWAIVSAGFMATSGSVSDAPVFARYGIAVLMLSLAGVVLIRWGRKTIQIDLGIDGIRSHERFIPFEKFSAARALGADGLHQTCVEIRSTCGDPLRLYVEGDGQTLVDEILKRQGAHTRLTRRRRSLRQDGYRNVRVETTSETVVEVMRKSGMSDAELKAHLVDLLR